MHAGQLQRLGVHTFLLCVGAPWQCSSCCVTRVSTSRRFLTPSILQEATVHVLRSRPKDHMTCFCNFVPKPFTASGHEDTRSHSYFTGKKTLSATRRHIVTANKKQHRQVRNPCFAKKLIKRTMAESLLFAVFANATSSRAFLTHLTAQLTFLDSVHGVHAAKSVRLSV